MHIMGRINRTATIDIVANAFESHFDFSFKGLDHTFDSALSLKTR